MSGKIGTEYQITELNTKLTHITSPAGICRFNNDIVVCDKESHCLVVIDVKGNYIKTIGELGSGPKEFCEPTGITTFNKHLYVLDAGNSRIKELDENFNRIQEIPLPALDHYQAQKRYIDIAVDSKGIFYVSTDSVGKNDAVIYAIDKGAAEKIEHPFVGYLTSYNGTVYAADTLELYTEGDVEGGASGKNAIYTIQSKRLKKIKNLPNKFTPSDFTVVNNKIYMISGLWGELNQFSLDGKYEKALVKLPNTSIKMYLQSLNSTDFLVSDTEKHALYILKK